jgi:hypothetical protein
VMAGGVAIALILRKRPAAPVATNGSVPFQAPTPVPPPPSHNGEHQTTTHV